MSSADRPDPPPDGPTFPKPLTDALAMWLANTLAKFMASSLTPRRPLTEKDLAEIVRRNNAVLKELDSLLSATTKRETAAHRIRNLLQQHKMPQGVEDPIVPVDLDSLPADQADLDERVRAIVAKAGTRT